MTTDRHMPPVPNPLPFGPEREELLLDYIDVCEEIIAYLLVGLNSDTRAEFDARMATVRESMGKGMPAMERALVAGVRFHKQPHLDGLVGPGDIAQLNPPKSLQ